jgi:alanine racemase
MRPVMTIHARIVRVFEIRPGEALGYGGTYRPEQVERAGLVTLGYADGYRRAFSNVAHMAVRGQPAPVIGRVSMDQTVIRLPDGLDVEDGEPVVVVGDGTDATAGAPTFNDLAGLIGTIPYELVCGIAPRMPRLYVQGGRVVAITDLFGLRELA